VKPLQLRRIVPIISSYDAIRWAGLCQFNGEGFVLTAKLHINVSQGIIDIEGEADLVREIYRDFKEQLLSGVKLAPSAVQAQDPAVGTVDETVGKQKSKRRATTKKKVGVEDGGISVSIDYPKLDKNLDTSKLAAFYSPFSPKNHSEKILIFLKFLLETLEIENPNTDQVYTCYKAVNEKIPQAFAQAFRDTSSKFGYIELKSATNITVPIAGDNHFTHTLKKKAAE
jgi:hypothetical protein